MKRAFQVFVTVVLLTGMNVVFGSGSSLRISFPLDGENVDCDGFFIVAHAEDLQSTDEGDIELKSEVSVTERYDDAPDRNYWTTVDPQTVFNSDPAQIEAVKPDAKDMTLKLFTPRKIPIITHFICSDSGLPEQIDITISFWREGVEVPSVGVTVNPEIP